MSNENRPELAKYTREYWTQAAQKQGLTLEQYLDKIRGISPELADMLCEIMDKE